MTRCLDTVLSLDTKKGGAKPNKKSKSMVTTDMTLLKGERPLDLKNIDKRMRYLAT